MPLWVRRSRKLLDVEEASNLVRPAIFASSAQHLIGVDRHMDIEFYDVARRRKISVPLEQVKKTVYIREVGNGKNRVHYLLTAQLNGTVLRKLVRRKDWLELDVPQA